jgi:hypothetical protein
MGYYYLAAESRVTQLDDALYAQWQANGNPKAAYYAPISNPPGPGYTYDGTDWIAPPVYIPQSVTRFQGKAALMQAGLLASVEAAVAASTDPLLPLAWDEALTFERQSAMVTGLAAALGLTSQQIDDLFVAAAQIQ